jgi:AraC-like DNA-binding protein
MGAFETGQPRATISGAWFRALLAAFEATGLEPRELCRRAGIDDPVVLDPDARVPRDWSVRLWVEASRQEPDPLLGLRVASAFELTFDDWLWHLLHSASDVEDALRLAETYQRILTAGPALEFVKGDDSCEVRLRPFRGLVPLPNVQVEFLTAAVLELLKRVTGGRLETSEVWLTTPGPSRPAYEDFFGCTVRFAKPRNSLVLGRACLSRPIAQGKRTRGRLLAMADEIVRELEPPSVALGVFAYLRDCFRAQEPWRASLEHAASAQHLSTRSLQRILAHEGTRFRDLGDLARRTVGLEEVKAGVHPSDVASRLGFSADSSFYRALRRWRGQDREFAPPAGERRPGPGSEPQPDASPDDA